MTAVLYVEDVLLVDRCLTGEPAATRELFRRHRGRVHACLFRVLGSNRDMDDLLQEAFLQVFQSLRSWRAEASLATWIDRVAVRCAYRYLAQRRRRIATDPLDDEAAGAVTAPEAGPGARRQLARDGVARLYAALDELSPAARLAFTLHELDGRSLAETAELVGSTVTATKLRVWRARKRIEAAAAADPVLREFAAGGPGTPIGDPRDRASPPSIDDLNDLDDPRDASRPLSTRARDASRGGAP